MPCPLGPKLFLDGPKILGAGPKPFGLLEWERKMKSHFWTSLKLYVPDQIIFLVLVKMYFEHIGKQGITYQNWYR